MSSPRERLAFSRDETSVDPSARSSITPTQSLDSIVRGRALSLTVIQARERIEPADRPAIDWRLITDLPVPTCAAAIEKLRWDALRWKIEVFHKILKSGCQTERARLRTAERLVKLIAVFCILSWRIFWMTM